MKNIQTSRVISFDGIDGSGKTTCIKAVADNLVTLGYEVLQTCEPKGTEFGEDLFDSMQMRHVTQHAAVYTTFAARAELFEKKIKPFVDANPNGFVLLDRHVFSTVAYHATGNSNLEHVIANLYASLRWMLDYKSPRPVKPYTPDVAVIFNVSPETALTRVLTRAKEQRMVLEPMELQDPARVLEYYEALTHTYKQIARHRGFGNHYFDIVETDAECAPHIVAEQTIARIHQIFEI